ncbi:MAG: sigma-70 family RNA polymerase sigma factor [candidate division Zixibacteria bacterium]|nr:sigma-70 family RNA polymerase sigma factor [candidate division Zixibacteria bacterium]
MAANARNDSGNRAHNTSTTTDRVSRWVDEHGDYLYRVAYSRVHDRWVAEDMVQETFLAAIKAYGQFQGRSSERTWLVGILKRKVIDHFRTVFRDAPPADSENAGDLDTMGHMTEGKWVGHWDPSQGPGDWGPNPFSTLEDKEFWIVLDRCLKAMPPRLAAVFTLYEIEEIRSEEICRELAITPTNLWVMLHRARKQLRGCLELNWFGRQHGEQS